MALATRVPIDGFTLVELMVTTALVATMVLAVAPLATNWIYGSQTLSGLTMVTEGFNVAKALALQNPNAVPTPSASAGMKLATDGTTTTVYVCTGSSTATGCGSGGGNVVWNATYSGLVTTTLNGATLTQTAPLTLDIDNRGELSAAAVFTITRGASGNTESFTLY
jgi:prepilin-type N-terminal cleavage/methylation domain-containing protein